MTRLRMRDLSAIPDYKPGKATDSGTPHDLPVYKLSSNENPYAPLPSVARALADQLSSVNRYPETAAATLTAMLCERFEVDAANLVFGSGSVEVLSQLIRATAGEGDEVVFAWRSFEAYPMLVLAAGATPVMVPLTAAHEHDFEAMLAAITDRTRLVIVCNPNNPTGTTVSQQQLDDFLARVPSDVVVLVDEAYVHFNRRADTAVGIQALRSHDNVVVAHTFSKAYGLAGLRIGYALAPAPVATAMRKVAIPFGVTSVAQAAAVASLRAEDELAARVDAIVAERERIAAGLGSLGVAAAESGGNFLWLPLGDATAAAVHEFENHGLLVRPSDGEGIRVTIGETAANDRILAVCARLSAGAELTAAR